MAGSGGKRPGAGRKSKAVEEKARNLAIEAIEQKYTGLKEGFMALLDSGEPTLMKFVFEHAVGKPKDSVTVDGNLGITWVEQKTYQGK